MRLFITILLIPLFSLTSFAQTQDKSLASEARNLSKSLSKQGWHYDGVNPLKTAIYNHLQKLNQGNEEIIGSVNAESRCRDLNKAKEWAKLNAYSSYAKRQGISVRASLSSELSSSDTGVYESFYQKSEASLDREIPSNLKLSFAIYRLSTDGIVEYKAYYIVDKSYLLVQPDNH